MAAINPRDYWTPRFPNPETAMPNGLLASGGDLEPATLLAAYRQGIFPWYGPDKPILWWTPNPRCVLFLSDFHVSKRSKRKIAASNFRFTIDQAFPAVVQACAAPRKESEDTWLLPEMQVAYWRLHLHGYAHSVEIWQEDRLVGGIYGLALGTVFFGESMFRRVTEGSRAALVVLMRVLRILGFDLLDCQQATPHMLAMGARKISRRYFMWRIRRGLVKTRTDQAQDNWRGYLNMIGEVNGIQPRYSGFASYNGSKL